MIDWRGLFGELRIEWKDRGANCARGRININCPFCWDDPSHHCTISEATGRFYCYRDAEHWGDAQKLVTKLFSDRKVARPRIHALALIDDYESGEAPDVAEVDRSNESSYEERFDPAFESQEMLDYLAQRGFDQPHLIASRYNLRYAQRGGWAKRLLFPLFDMDNRLAGWTGRAIRADLQPRYRAHPPERLVSLVAGDMRGESLVVVEGPIDAIKGCNALIGRGITCIGLTGLLLSPERLACICHRPRKRLWLALDAEAPINIKLRMKAEQRMFVSRGCNPELLLLEEGDFGMMSEAEIVRLIEGAGTGNGPAMARGIRELGASLGQKKLLAR